MFVECPDGHLNCAGFVQTRPAAELAGTKKRQPMVAVDCEMVRTAFRFCFLLRGSSPEGCECPAQNDTLGTVRSHDVT